MKTNVNERKSINASKDSIADALETLELNKDKVGSLLYLYLHDQLASASYNLCSLKMVD